MLTYSISQTHIETKNSLNSQKMSLQVTRGCVNVRFVGRLLSVRVHSRLHVTWTRLMTDLKSSKFNVEEESWAADFNAIGLVTQPSCCLVV